MLLGNMIKLSGVVGIRHYYTAQSVLYSTEQFGVAGYCIFGRSDWNRKVPLYGAFLGVSCNDMGRYCKTSE